MGMLTGFMAGVGRGLRDGAKMAYDNYITEQRDEKQFQRQVQRDDVMAARQDVRDERNHQQLLERDKNQLKIRLEEVREAAKITHKLQSEYGAAALAEIQQVRQKLGPKATDAQVRAALSDPNAIKAFDAQAGFVNDQRKLDDDMKTNAAQRAASYASVDARNQDRKTAAEKRADEARAREVMINLTKAQRAGNDAAAQALQEEYIRLTGSDPLKPKDGDYSVVYEGGDFGDKKPVAVFNKNTGTASPYPGTGGGGPTVGERRVINGQRAEWDGRGWKAVK